MIDYIDIVCLKSYWHLIRKIEFSSIGNRNKIIFPIYFLCLNKLIYIFNKSNHTFQLTSPNKENIFNNNKIVLKQ